MRHSNGFTLLEVMLAISIFAIIATSISLGMSNASNAALQLEQRVLSRWVLENELNRVMYVSVGIPDEVVDVEMGGYEWQVSFESQPMNGESLKTTNYINAVIRQKENDVIFEQISTLVSGNK